MENNVRMSELLKYLLKKWWILLICICLFGGLSFFVGKKVSHSSYKAELGVQLTPKNMQYYDVKNQINLMDTYKEVANSDKIMKQANNKLREMNSSYNGSTSELNSMTSFSFNNGSLIMNISDKSDSSIIAKDATKAVAKAFVKNINNVMHSNVNVKIIKPASGDYLHYYPSKEKKITFVGCIFGLFVGLIVCLFDFYLKNVKVKG